MDGPPSSGRRLFIMKCVSGVSKVTSLCTSSEQELDANIAGLAFLHAHTHISL